MRWNLQPHALVQDSQENHHVIQFDAAIAIGVPKEVANLEFTAMDESGGSAPGIENPHLEGVVARWKSVLQGEPDSALTRIRHRRLEPGVRRATE